MESKELLEAQYANHQERDDGGKKSPNSVFIDVREWRDKTYGNTYYSAIVSVDGEWQFTTGMTYGYGDQAIYDSVKRLSALGILPALGDMISPRYDLENLGVVLYTARRDVLKRELPKQSEREDLRDMTGAPR